MVEKNGVRPGGRSARIQAAVHQAVRQLQQQEGQGELTVPAVAACAGVTPSTIYRRWGDLAQLLSDVALERVRPDGEPRDTGSYREDLRAWLEQYIDELASEPGRAIVRDILACPAPGNAGKCAEFIRRQLDVIRDRARARGEPVVDSDTLIDLVVAPVVYRLLFSISAPSIGHAVGLLDHTLGSAALRRAG
ncbi:TetR-like C-terminal domain-containing protein [Acerihabitans arboris]|uniref:TetR family transcriptional regulator n=1 Tax=Acerihabitans arboris TaxID=2691583 RepID=A0A845SGN6_9GAMM|nr:TetR-like C-terminal domain-containing protein [Acerihabitans arboris]NDL61791.1 TetR family transcriptional regulator [Acerihabitans arboris]